MMSLHKYSTTELQDRYEVLDAWIDLESSTAGRCNHLKQYADLRESIFGPAEGFDPYDEYNDVWAVDAELGNRSKSNA